MPLTSPAALTVSRRAALGGLLALAGCSQKVAVKAVAPPPPLKVWPTLDALCEAAVAGHMAPGLSVSVMRDGVMLYSRGFGLADLRGKRAVSNTTAFRIASVSKQFTAAAILQLAEAGALSLDDPLVRFLPQFPRAGDITLREMLSHTSGLGDYINGQKANILSEAQNRDYDSEALYGVISTSTPLFPYTPGMRWSYSNSGFSLLGLVVEKLTGQTLASALAQKIFAPAGLERTAIDPVGAAVPDMSLGYRSRTAADFGEVHPSSPTFTAGAGGIRSTTADLVRWHHALLTGKIVSAKSLAMMTTPAVLKSGEVADIRRGANMRGYGFGLEIGQSGDLGFIAHGGRVNGYTSNLRTYTAQKVTVSCLFNSDGTGMHGYWDTMRAVRHEATRLGLAEAGVTLPPPDPQPV